MDSFMIRGSNIPMQLMLDLRTYEFGVYYNNINPLIPDSLLTGFNPTVETFLKKAR